MRRTPIVDDCRHVRVNVEFNNEAIDMTDANDKAVEAFIYNGTTYVPIRAVSNAFGADIGL